MLNKVGTSGKLYLLILITAASLVGLGLYAINDLKKMNDNTKTLYTDRILCMQQLSNIRRVYSRDIRTIPQSIKSRELSFSEAKIRIQRAQKIIDTNWRNYKRTNFTPEEKLLVKQADILKNNADENNKDLLAILANGDTLAINKLVLQQNPAESAPFAVKVTQLIDLQVSIAKDILNNNKKLYQITSAKLVLFILLSLVIALSLSFYIIKNIRNLIRDMAKGRDIIKESENKYRSILENASDAIYLADNEGRFIDANDSMCKMLGYSKEELLRINFSDIIDPENLKANPIERPTVPNQSIFKERTFITSNGKKVDVEINGQRLDENKLMGVARDVTERRRIETERREAEMKFRTLVEKSTVGVYISQYEKFIYVNPRIAEIFGYTAGELLDFPDGAVEVLFAEESRKVIRANIKARYNGEIDGSHYQVVGMKKDGTIIQLEIYGNIVAIDGKPAVIGTMMDITERKQAEELVLKEKELSETIINSLPGIFYLRDENGRGLRWNKNLETVTGYTAEEIKGTVLRSFVAEEDREALSRAAETTFKEGFASAEARVVTKDGRKIPFLLSGKPIHYGDQPCLLGTGIDISSRIKAEESLRESEARFRGAFENASIGVALASLKGEWLQVNGTLCEILGYTEKELIQLTFKQITHPDDLERDMEFMHQAINGQRDSYTVEKRYLHKDGSIVWANLNVTMIRDQNRRPLYFLSITENITEKVESQLKFQTLVENFIVGVYIHQNGKIVYVNPRLMEESGYAEEDLLGRPIDQFIYRDDLGLVKKITEQRENEHIDTVRYEARFVRKDGQPIWFEIFGSRTVYQGAPALMGTMINVSERKAVYDELKKSEANLRSIFDSTDVSYLLLDAKFNIISLNEQMKDIYRDSVGIMLKEGDNLISLIRPERRSIMQELYDSVLLTKKPSAYESSFTNNGIAKHFAASVFPIIVGDEAIGICISTIDITERKNALEKLQETNESLQKHAKELAISNAELEQFAYVASHDLQEPLRMVTSFMTQLEKKYGDVVDDKGKQYIYFAVDGAKRMRRIILDLLDFSRVGKTEDDLELVDFNKLIEEVLALFRRKIEEVHAHISFENLPTIQAYRTPVRQVFQNLIDNSLKYQKANEVPSINISCKETKTGYQFAVRDNGIGIDSAYFDKIFVIFQRLHNKDEYSGTGMGLAITKKIIENLGGKIWVESEEGKGSTFYFTLLKKR
ncbi:MAG: PAS domain S-box protein [Mucilaginibacter sp.]